ncbi:hypothetical protein CEXT_523431 [Caerostris extrusa]|uniref:Uncharacterized protein n=1 Tax=Caerostris extrusa TaxID=172846 RepID=A0AAV4NRK7_CAEEX|nr:hypothetical protein CEXT_523431 [Caerostris extrusa]
MTISVKRSLWEFLKYIFFFFVKLKINVSLIFAAKSDLWNSPHIRPELHSVSLNAWQLTEAETKDLRQWLNSAHERFEALELCRCPGPFRKGKRENNKKT